MVCQGDELQGYIPAFSWYKLNIFLHCALIIIKLIAIIWIWELLKRKHVCCPQDYVFGSERINNKWRIPRKFKWDLWYKQCKWNRIFSVLKLLYVKVIASMLYSNLFIPSWGWKVGYLQVKFLWRNNLNPIKILSN